MTNNDMIIASKTAMRTLPTVCKTPQDVLDFVRILIGDYISSESDIFHSRDGILGAITYSMGSLYQRIDDSIKIESINHSDICPPEELLRSMAHCIDEAFDMPSAGAHDYRGSDIASYQEHMLNDMRKIFNEIVGAGNWQPKNLQELSHLPEENIIILKRDFLTYKASMENAEYQLRSCPEQDENYFKQKIVRTNNILNGLKELLLLEKVSVREDFYTNNFGKSSDTDFSKPNAFNKSYIELSNEEIKENISRQKNFYYAAWNVESERRSKMIRSKTYSVVEENKFNDREKLIHNILLDLLSLEKTFD